MAFSAPGAKCDRGGSRPRMHATLDTNENTEHTQAGYALNIRVCLKEGLGP